MKLTINSSIQQAAEQALAGKKGAIVVLDPRTKDPDSVPAKIAAALKERIDAGKTGVDAGEGFYRYN